MSKHIYNLAIALPKFKIQNLSFVFLRDQVYPKLWLENTLPPTSTFAGIYEGRIVAGGIKLKENEGVEQERSYVEFIHPDYDSRWVFKGHFFSEDSGSPKI